jgi:hypothetical protein
VLVAALFWAVVGLGAVVVVTGAAVVAAGVGNRVGVGAGVGVGRGVTVGILLILGCGVEVAASTNGERNKSTGRVLVAWARALLPPLVGAGDIACRVLVTNSTINIPKYPTMINGSITIMAFATGVWRSHQLSSVCVSSGMRDSSLAA